VFLGKHNALKHVTDLDDFENMYYEGAHSGFVIREFPAVWNLPMQ
jgi:hypothetical protein